LVEIMQTEGSRERIDQYEIASGGGDNVGKVEFEEVGRTNEGVGVDIANEGLETISR
jgi:hypothetical protein